MPNRWQIADTPSCPRDALYFYFSLAQHHSSTNDFHHMQRGYHLQPVRYCPICGHWCLACAQYCAGCGPYCSTCRIRCGLTGARHTPNIEYTRAHAAAKVATFPNSINQLDRA